MTEYIELFKQGSDTWITGPFLERDDDLFPVFSGRRHKALKLTGRPDKASFAPGLLYNETTDSVGALPPPGPVPPLGEDAAAAEVLINQNVWAAADRSDGLKLILKKLYLL